MEGDVQEGLQLHMDNFVLFSCFPGIIYKDCSSYKQSKVTDSSVFTDRGKKKSNQIKLDIWPSLQIKMVTATITPPKWAF